MLYLYCEDLKVKFKIKKEIIMNNKEIKEFIQACCKGVIIGFCVGVIFILLINIIVL